MVRTKLHAELDLLLVMAIESKNILPSKDFPETMKLIHILHTKEENQEKE